MKFKLAFGQWDSEYMNFLKSETEGSSWLFIWKFQEKSNLNVFPTHQDFSFSHRIAKLYFSARSIHFIPEDPVFS